MNIQEAQSRPRGSLRPRDVARHQPTITRCICALLLFVAIGLSGCGDGRAACFESSSPERACGPGAACTWVSEEGSVCLATCESDSACAGGERCLSRPLLTFNTELACVDVCVAEALLDSPGLDASDCP